MTDEARRVYLRFATFFLVTGAAFLLVGVLRATVLPDVLRGNPIPVALLLLAIGGGLRWTVHRDPGPPKVEADPLESDEDGPDPEAGTGASAPPKHDDRPG